MSNDTKTGIITVVIIIGLVIGLILMVRSFVNAFVKTRVGLAIETKLNYWLAEPNDVNNCKNPLASP